MLKTMKNKIKLNNKTHKLATFAMLRRGERFGEDIGRVFRSCYMRQFNCTLLDFIVKMMCVNVDMFGAGLVNGVY